MSGPSRILFYADSGAAIGGGHVMRCLTLAEALADRGASCAFAATPEAAAILAAFGSGRVQALAADGTVADVARLAGEWDADWILVDHYRLVTADETALRAPERRIAVIDDLAERARDCDLVLDPSYGRTAQAYVGLIPSGATVLTGPQFALVRAQFAAARSAALARRGARPVQRGLVSLGLTDVGGVTGQVVERLLPYIGDVSLDVVVGRGAPSLLRLRDLAAADPRLVLHVESLEMASLIAGADLGIGAGGSSTWERCCLGLPTLTLILADNQRPLAMAFDRDGISPATELDGLGEAWEGLVEDGARRARLSAASAALCDGLGAGRVAEALLDLQPHPSRSSRRMPGSRS